MKKTGEEIKQQSGCFHLTGIGRLSLSSLARCIHDTAEEEVNANKPSLIPVCRSDVGWKLPSAIVATTMYALHSFVLPLPSREGAVKPRKDRVRGKAFARERGQNDTDKSFQRTAKYSDSVYSVTAMTRASVHACSDRGHLCSQTV